MDLTGKEQAEALRKYQLISPFLQKQQTLSALCKKQLPLRTPKHWVAQYYKQGLAGLARKQPKDKWTKPTCSTLIQQLIKGLHLQQPHLSGASIYRKLRLIDKNYYAVNTHY